MFGCFLLTHLTLTHGTLKIFAPGCIKIYDENRTFGLCMTLDLIHNSLQLTHVLLLRMKLIGKENQAHCMNLKPLRSFFFFLFFLKKHCAWGSQILFNIRIGTHIGDGL